MTNKGKISTSTVSSVILSKIFPSLKKEEEY